MPPGGGFAPPLDLLSIALRMAVAIVCAAVIGLDREVLAHPAGLRTHILVSLAASTFAIVALELAHRGVGSGNWLSLDPTRVVEAVTAGVAFLAAGTIIRASGHVEGLTTGASLWLSGAIGMACGIGELAVAAIATAFGFIVLVVLRLVERHMPADSKKTADRRDDT